MSRQFPFSVLCLALASICTVLVVLPITMGAQEDATAHPQPSLQITNGDPDQIEITYGISFAQVDFTFEGAEDDNTTYGLAIINHAEVEAQIPSSDASEWYLNIVIYDPPYAVPRWAVQNLPLVSPYVMDGVSTFFSLLPEIEAGEAMAGRAGGGPAHRGKVPYVPWKGYVAPKPISKPPASTPPPRKFQMPPVNLKFNNAGFQAPVPPGYKIPDFPRDPPCPPEPEGETREKAILPQNNLKAVQEGVNQCVPGSVNNSCQYLCDTGTCGDDFRKPNLENCPGINGSKCQDGKQSRVGQLDVRMKRAPGALTSGYDMLTGKLRFLCEDWGKSDDTFTVQHQGEFCSPFNPPCVHGDKPTSVTCGQTAKRRTISSTGKGKPTIKFISDAIQNDKADLELLGPFVLGEISSGHAAHIVGYAKTDKVDGIWIIQDAEQGNNDRGVEYDQGGRQFVCLKTLDNGTIVMKNFPAANGKAVITNLIEEMPKSQ